MSRSRRSTLLLSKAERGALRRAGIRLAELAELEAEHVVAATGGAIALTRAEQLCGMEAYAAVGVREEIAADLFRAGYRHPRQLTGVSALGVATMLEATRGSLADERSIAALAAAIAKATSAPPLPGNTRRAERPERPRALSPDEVRIEREGPVAVIQPADAAMAVTHFHLGDKGASMSDVEVLAAFNHTMEAMAAHRAEVDLPAIEVPPGRPQIEWHERSWQWCARGHVLRCIVTDDAQGEPRVIIDDKELDWAQFGRLVRSFAGWGMRLAFVPDDEIEEQPDIEVREPDESSAP